MGRECSPLLLHRTTPSVHVQTSGQPDAGRQPLSSAPAEREKKETQSGILDKEKDRQIRKRDRGVRERKRATVGGNEPEQRRRLTQVGAEQRKRERGM